MTSPQTPNSNDHSNESPPSLANNDEYIEVAEVVTTMEAALSAVNQEPNYRIETTDLNLLKEEGVVSDAEIAELSQELKL